MTTDDALFDVPELVLNPARCGRVEAGLQRALRAGHDAGTLVAEDAGMIGGALAAARALDGAEAIGGTKGGYLIAQLLTSYREALHSLRLPAQLTPATPPPPAATERQDTTPEWLRDSFGTAE